MSRKTPTDDRRTTAELDPVLPGARRDGQLALIRHDVISHTSFMEDFVEPATQPARALCACANGATTQRLVQLNVGVPTFQRAPGEATTVCSVGPAVLEACSRLREKLVQLAASDVASPLTSCSRLRLRGR